MVTESGRDRLQEAVRILVDEADRIKQRLLIAYASELSRIDPERDLPEPVRAEFDEMKNGLSDAEMPYGLGEHASKKIEKMSEQEASKYAGWIFQLFLKACGP